MVTDRKAARAAMFCTFACFLGAACLSGCPATKPKPQQLGGGPELDGGAQESPNSTSSSDREAGTEDTGTSGSRDGGHTDSITDASPGDLGDGDEGTTSDGTGDAGASPSDSCTGRVGSPANNPEPDCTPEASVELNGFMSDLLSVDRVANAQLTETGCGNTAISGPDGWFTIRVPAYDSIYIRATADGYAPGLSRRVDTTSDVSGRVIEFPLIAADLVTPFRLQCANEAVVVVQVSVDDSVIGRVADAFVSDDRGGHVTYTDIQLQAHAASSTDSSGMAVIDGLTAPNDDVVTATYSDCSQLNQDRFPVERGYVTAARVEMICN
jgi:hypothetical protein